MSPSPLRAALVALCVGSAAAIISDCGSPHFKASSLAIFPDPPVPGQACGMNVAGTVDELVSNGTIQMSVVYIGIPLYSAPAAVCGNTTIELPLGAGTIILDGFQQCPTAANSLQTLNMSLTLPTITPPGPYENYLNASAQAGNWLYCLNISFTE